jgi:hypothetical protein
MLPRKPSRSTSADELETDAAAAEEKAAPVVQRRPVSQKSGRTVTVACKIPPGLVLQLQRPLEKYEDTREGPQPRTYWVKYGPIHVVKGPAYPCGTVPKGFPKPPIIEGGYALTPGIPADFWEQWAEQNKNADFFHPANGADHGAIFAYPDMEDVVAAAAEQEGCLTGLEPLSTDEDSQGRLTDRRLPRPANMALTKISPDTDRMNQRG